ncbi:type I 3-dehydroquinate dehydratase [Alienimonas californiensis]|uniref:Multifunctional fusion protein n=1 Tax=Alienimonas californiensis TaxID=2527989 RepID=A0A517PD31_9PLAN|nr:type I 3-dehydroquinate dehydratase [Alienimonas californiensis]QDT17285.1 Shikimate dehydrogenase [Alienimonas californiensis]
MPLCVSIARSHPSRMRAEHAVLAEAGAKLVELRLDWLKGPVDVAALIADRPTPVVLTCRRREDGGRWSGTEEARLALLRQAILAEPEFVDLEGDVAPKVPRFGKAKRVVSHHDMKATPDAKALAKLYKQLAAADADVVKLVTTAESIADNARVLSLYATATKPTVAFCMGEFGLASRVMCCAKGAPWTYASFSAERTIAPGLPDFATMRTAYRAHRVKKTTQFFGVLGDPVAHSLSPQLHNAAFREAGFDGCYLPVRVTAEEFPTALPALAAMGFEGFSVTIPHKAAALALASGGKNSATDAARRIGAANTLTVTGAKESAPVWHAANTDHDAALGSLLAEMRRADKHATLTGRKVLVLGSGGVARAVVAALTGAGCAVTVAGRTEKKARALVDEFGGVVQTWPNRGTGIFEIIVNGTPVGMWPKMDESPLPENRFPPQAIVFDTIYNPNRTLFLKQAAERDCRIVGGADMFVRQAEAQYALFTGSPAPEGVMREALQQAMAVAK